MKINKHLCLLLVIVLTLGMLTACGEKDTGSTNTNLNTNNHTNTWSNTNGYTNYNRYNTGWQQEEEREPITCWSCFGDGECRGCDGTGKVEHYPDWAGDRCRTCDGNGRCIGCDGRGYYK